MSRCLASLVDQTLEPGSFEVVVADDEPGRRTRELVERYRGLHRGIRYVAVAGSHGPAAARNRGWRAATGEVVAFTDDDCVPSRDWLEGGLAALGRADAASGRVVVPIAPRPTDYERDAARLQDAGFVTANAFCRRDVLASLGGFDERFTRPWREDSDLYFRLLEGGYRVVEAPRAVVVHPVRPARFGVSVEQQSRAAFDALLYKKHKALYRNHVEKTPPRHYYAAVVSLAGGALAAASGMTLIALWAVLAWGFFTVAFCARRLAGCRRSPGHVAEMALTSALIPPVALYWRLRGAVRHRVLFL